MAATASFASFRPQQFSYHRSSGAASSSSSSAAAPKSASIPCKFWLQGRCNRGDSCRFSHDDKAAAAPPAPPLPPKRSNCWIRPTSSPQLHHQEASPDAFPDQQPQLMEKEESVVAATQPQKVHEDESITEAAAADSMVESSICSSSAADTTATATGVSSVSSSILVVTSEDGSICVQDADRLHERRLHRLHSPITCVVDCPVQQQVHPGLLVVGLASGEIGVVSFNKEALDMNVHIIAGPSQSCGKVLSIVSASTPLHPFLIIAGYENGAILCWTRSTDSSFTPLCALQYPASASVVSIDISEFEEEDIIGGGHKKKMQLLYSSSTDGSIAVWELEGFTRLQKQPAASQVAITKLLAAGRYIFCGCADGSIQAWGPTATSSMELLYTQASPRQGAATAVVDLCGQSMEDGRHVLFAAYNDNTVSKWELPTFKEMDVIQVQFGIRAMDVGTSTSGAVLLLAGTGGSAMGVPLQ